MYFFSVAIMMTLMCMCNGMEDAAKMWLLIGTIDVFVISLRPLTITEDDILDDLIKDFNKGRRN